MRPLELNYVVKQDKVGNPAKPLPASGESFLETGGAGITLVTWKAAEDGNGTILRLAETTGKPTETTIHIPRSRIAEAKLASGVEDDQRTLPVNGHGIRLSFRPFEVLTVRVVNK
jgi:alpha-mannosidase